MSGDELAARLEDPRLYLIDVREPDEVAAWQIPGAHSIPLASLHSRLGEVPLDKDLVLVCAKGTRAREGVELLAEEGIESRVLDGGMGAWGSTYDHVTDDFAGELLDAGVR